jgi:tRNA (guanine37-N1)-methyltransferase
LRRAIENGKISVRFYNPRDFVKPTTAQKKKKKPYLRVDDKPYGGGPGMVIQAEPVAKAIEAAIKRTDNRKQKAENRRQTADNRGQKADNRKQTTENRQKTTGKKKTAIIFLSPAGRQFTTDYAKKAAKKWSDIIIICGRYEGIDARVKKIFKAEEVSVGPFVLTGGELPAMLMIDSISRQIEGVLGDFNSLEESRVSSSDVYTRPEVFEYKGKKYRVPKVLVTGHHAKIDSWKKMAK